MSVLHSNLLTSVQPRAAKGFVMLKEALIMIAAAITGYWLWKNKILADWSISKQIAVVIVLYILGLFLEKGFSNKTENVDIDDDIFLDNAPNPTPPPTNPPTSEQIEFMEFMKQKRQKQEREKELIRRE